MKKMKTTLAIAIALAAGVGTSAYAQLVKQDTITLALTLQGQSSVSTSATVVNAGNFSQGPLYYKTSTSKFTQANLLKSIAVVLHKNNPNFYTSQASLELVQGELGGFWNITDPLAQSYPLYDDLTYNSVDTGGWLTGSFNEDGYSDYNPFIYDNFYYDYYYGYLGLGSGYGDDVDGQLPGPWWPDNDYPAGPPDGTYGYDAYGYDPVDSPVYNYFDSYLPEGVDLSSRTSIADGVNEYVRLDTGRHFLPVPWASYDTTTDTGTPYATTGEYPVGHMQPWGQVYVKDPGNKDSSGDPLCENVTFFFDFEVQECYDCFYLSSFISDATFKNNQAPNAEPPCCSLPGYLTGKGTDRYYLTLDFDNTVNNSYLNPVYFEDTDEFYYGFVGFAGLDPLGQVNETAFRNAGDGLTADLLSYSDPIRSHLSDINSPYEARFTLKGIVTYNWTLKFINNSDIAPDYIGTATYACTGYGFIALICDLITGSATFTETAVKDVGCCDDESWYYQTYNTDWNGNFYGTTATGWYGPGWDGGWGYFNPRLDTYDPYYYNNYMDGEYTIDAGAYEDEMPYQFESPYNPPTALTRHVRDDGSSGVDNPDNADVYNNNYEYYYDYVEECQN